MKSISAELKSHLASGVTTLATCWKLTRRDGVVMGFTDHDRDLEYEGVPYQAATGVSSTAVASGSDLAADNLEIGGMLDADSIAEADILAGIYDFARLEMFLLNYADLTQGALSIRSGYLGELRQDSGRFVAEIRGLTQRLATTIGALFSPGCRAELGDAHCAVNLEAYTRNGSVTGVTSQQAFTDEWLDESAGFFDFGRVTFTGGDNAGLSMEVQSYSESGLITLMLPMPYALASGDTFAIQAGCDKTFATCAGRFDNALNFRGEPHVPGTDRILKTAGTA